MADENQNTTPTFTPEQQAFINQVIDGRIGKTKAQADKDKADAVAAAVAEKEAEIERLKEAVKKGGSADTEAERAQIKALLDAEKLNTKQALEHGVKHKEAAEKLFAENRSILKGQTIREAMDAQETFSFVDPRIVRQLVDHAIVFDDDSSSWVVKENGLVRQNSSLQPMTVKEYLAEFAAQHPFLVKSSSKGGAGSTEGAGKTGAAFGKVTSKADLKSAKEKSDYITKFGFDAFAALPAK